jgi:hypothetical protein
MRYFFVFLAIAAIWAAVLLIALTVQTGSVPNLYLAAQTLTVTLFYIGFYSK